MSNLLTFTDKPAAIAARPDLFVDGEMNAELALETTAYTALAVEPAYDEQGEPIPGTGSPAVVAAGYWLLLAEAIDAPPIILPPGIVAISPIYTSPMLTPVADD